MSKLARRYRKRKKKNPSSPRSNPPLASDMLEVALPAGGGFVATRLLTKLAVMLIAKKWPSKSKHAGAVAAVTAALSAWYLGHKLKFLAKYHTPITAGAVIAAGVNLLQIYVPKIGWLFGDPTEATAGGTSTQKLVAANAAAAALPSGMEEIDDDPAFYTYNDAYDAGRYNQSAGVKQQPSPPVGSSQPLLEDESWGGSNVFSSGLAGN